MYVHVHICLQRPAADQAIFPTWPPAKWLPKAASSRNIF